MRQQSLNRIPSLRVARVLRLNSMPSRLLNSFGCGTVASPMPTVPIAPDSTRRTEICRPNVLASTAAVIPPAVPPPTIMMLLMHDSVMGTPDPGPSRV